MENNFTSHSLGNISLDDVYFGNHMWYIVLLSTVMIFGTFGNLLVIAAVVVHKPLRTTGNMFIVNLAIADLCVTAFVDPFSIIGAVDGERMFVEIPYLCDSVAIACVVSCTCSLFTIAGIAVNRYIMICKNRIYSGVFTYKRTLMYCVGLWILCICLCLINLLGWGGHWFDPKMMICTINRLKDYSFTICFWSFNVFSPLLFIAAFYLKIFIFVKRSNKKIKLLAGKSATIADRRRRDELQLTKTLFVIFFVFVICWFPLFVIILYDKMDKLPKYLYNIALLFAHTSSSVNSIIYAATNKRFRRGYKAVLCDCFAESALPKRRSWI